MRFGSFTFLVLAGVLAVAACSDSGASDSGSSGTETSDTSSSSSGSSATVTEDETSAASTDIETIGGSLGTAFDLAVGWLNGHPIDEVSYTSLFSDEFQNMLTFEQFEATLAGLGAEGPWIVTDFFATSETSLDALVESADELSWVLTVAIEDPDQVVISTLFISPVPEAPNVASLDEALAQLEESGRLRFLAAEVTDGSCLPIRAEAADDPAPLGSIFKLYVLGAIIDAVAAGQLTWDTPVVIRSELFSIPSGVTQQEEPGIELTVRELSERMISISDNTATDHLIDVVGRSAVEEALVTYGHSDPQLNRPFLATRQFTILKFSDDADRRQRYMDGSEEGRRAVLDEMAGEPLPPVASIISVTDPIDVETLEWFASPNDLCELLVGLVDDDEGRRILGLNPGAPDLEGTWDYLGFKGGSEPGVLAMAWFGTTPDGRSYVVAGSVANEDELIAESEVAGLFGAARDLTPSAG